MKTEEIRNLPQRQHGWAYIYAGFQGNKIVYIGQTINLKQRMYQYSASNVLQRWTKIEYMCCVEEMARLAESILIQLYQPEWNVQEHTTIETTSRNIWFIHDVIEQFNKNELSFDQVVAEI